jgi:hypothetical protein
MTVSGKRQLWLRSMDALQAQPSAGTTEAAYPFWSPDSRYIGFFAHGQLKKIAAIGGPAQSLCDAPNGQGGSWNREDVIVFSGAGGNPIQRVSAGGGVPADVTKLKVLSRSRVFLPDGRRFLYLVAGVFPDRNGVYISSLDGRENRRVLVDTSSVAFVRGRLLFIRDKTLMAQPFDSATGKTLSDAFPVAESVSLYPGFTLRFQYRKPDCCCTRASRSSVIRWSGTIGVANCSIPSASPAPVGTLRSRRIKKQ